MECDNNKIAQQELNLNIKYQNIQVKYFTKIGYEWEKGIYIFMLMIPKKMLGFKIKAGRMK